MIDLSEETSIVSNLVFVDSKVPDFEYILEEYKQTFPGVLTLYMKNSDANRLLNPWNGQHSYEVGSPVDIRLPDVGPMDNFNILSGIVRSCNLDNTFSVEVDMNDAAFGTVLCVSQDNIRLMNNSSLCLNDNLVEFGIIDNLVQSFDASDNYSDFHVCQTKLFTKLCIEKRNTGCYRKMYKSVHRWFKTVDLFKKKFILFPIHECHHWFLICYVNPGKFLLEVQQDPNIQKLGKKLEDSFAFVMDSLPKKNGMKSYKSHFEIINHFLSLLFVATKTNSVDYAIGEIGIGWLEDYYKSLSTKMETFVLKTPKQPNEYDCGMYLIKNCRNLFHVLPSLSIADFKDIMKSRDLHCSFNYLHCTIHLERENLFISIRDKLLLFETVEISPSRSFLPGRSDDIMGPGVSNESLVLEDNNQQCIQETISKSNGYKFEMKRKISPSFDTSIVFQPLTFDYVSDDDNYSLCTSKSGNNEGQEVLTVKKIKKYSGLGALNWNDDFF